MSRAPTRASDRSCNLRRSRSMPWKSRVEGVAAAMLLVTALLGVAHAEPPAPAEPAPAEPAPAEPAPTATTSKAPVVSDGPVAVTTRLTPDPSNVGDLLVLEVVAAYPRDVRVNLPTRLSLDPLHHVRTEDDEPEPTGDGLRKTFRIVLQHFEVGQATIPSFPLTYVDAEGAVHTVQIPARTFTVESLLANEDDPQRRDEDPPISREYPDTLAETIAWSVLATLLVALVAWLVVRRLRARNRSVPAPPPIPPHELAFEALEELERGELLAQGQVQRYYVELTEIAKGYLEGRFGVDALDRTTDEIRRALLKDGQRLAPLSPDAVVEFLQQCDLVKFARLAPADDESREALETVREMVQRSVPEPTTAPSRAADAMSRAKAEDAAAEPAEQPSKPEAATRDAATRDAATRDTAGPSPDPTSTEPAPSQPEADER